MSRTFRNLILLLAVVLGLSGSTFASPIESITITGGERSSGGVWDTGTVTVTVNGVSVSVAYGQYSTPASIASSLGATISQKCSFPVYAHAVGAVLNFYKKGTNVISSATLTSTSSNSAVFSGASFLIDGSSGGVTVPTISLSSSSGTPGSSLTISAVSGTSFGATQGSSTVSLGGTTVAPSSWSASSIVVAVPSTLVASLNPVSVTIGGLASFAVPFTVVPKITNVSFDSIDSPIPATNLATALSGPPQVGFVIVGSGFGANDSAENTYVTLNGSELNTISWSNNEIIVQVPAGFATGGPYYPVVTVAGISSNQTSISFNVVTPLECAN
jgi:hypothetical protein